MPKMPEEVIQSVCQVASSDVYMLHKKGEEYGESWYKRGGVGAFMMLARKWDRIESQLETAEHEYNIMTAITQNPGRDGILDDVRDLRRYLLLIEAKLLEQGHVSAEDNTSELMSATAQFVNARDQYVAVCETRPMSAMATRPRTNEIVQTTIAPPREDIENPRGFVVDE